ncbi:hypothetical protein [Microbacterium pumilum]|uniref:Uncharacterized protein n=1 Tax=Microbacterium pumilum TaxID=344165 RepID=A0ABN2SLN6_9MICO
MSFLSRFRRHGTPDAALTEEESIARYVYLLNTLPPSVIESAHAKAFQDVPPERRREMFDQLKPFMSETEKDAASDDPTVLARLIRRAEERRAERAASNGATASGEPDDGRDSVDPRTMMQNTGVMTLVAYQFLLSSSVSSYFVYGAGSLELADQPDWVAQTYDPAPGVDPTGAGADQYGAGGFDGGSGFDGGGFGGGFDGAGFGGGGFDGAGG